MRNGPRLLSASAFAGAVLAFTLPFGTVSSCDGEEVRFTGGELVTFSVPPDDDPDPELHSEIESNAGVPALCALLAAVLGFALVIGGWTGGGICAAVGLVAAQLLGLVILLSTDAGGTPHSGFWLLVLALAFACLVHLVDAVRARRQAGRRVWGYAFARCVLTLLPTLGAVALLAIAVLSTVS